jgi:hypothetical protein
MSTHSNYNSYCASLEKAQLVIHVLKEPRLAHTLFFHPTIWNFNTLKARKFCATILEND